MSDVRVFDPAMCCDSGVCGPKVDPVLPRFAADLDWLRQQGVMVTRFNLARQPQAFVDTPAVQAALQEDPERALPLVLVDGVEKSRGRYPSREELANWSGMKSETAAAAPAKSCCGPSCGC